MSTGKEQDTTWSRFVHFKAVEGDGPHLSKLHWGEPVDPDIDVGLAMLQDPTAKVKVRVWSETQIFDPKGHFTGEILTIDRLMSPIVIQGTPRSVLVNYHDRAEELGIETPSVPVIIMKPPNVHNGLFSTVEIPPIAQDEEIDFGVTLAIIIGQQCHDVAEEDSLDVVFGYTCGNERTARKVEQKYGSTYAKSFDRFSPLGPVIINPRTLPSNEGITLETRVNGELMQSGNTKDMIFSIPKIIAHVTRGTTIWPGTVIFTGTPGGCGWNKTPKVWLKDGDRVECFGSHGIGTLSTDVIYLSEDTVRRRGKEDKERVENNTPAWWNKTGASTGTG